MFGLSMIVMVTISTRMGAAAYYVKYVLDRPGDTGLFLTSYGASLAAGSLVTPVLAGFMDKRHLMIAAMILVGVLCSAFWFIPKDQVGMIYALNIAIGLALGPKSPLTFAMYADSADYNEYRTGRRATAMTFAAASFAQKLGGALASAVIGWVLAGLGYVANTVQSGASQTGILLLMSVVPAALAFVAAGLMLFYNLSDKRLVDMQAELMTRRAD
ncbi:MAG: MFS transporter [Asticcacaulis sp.]